MGWDFLLPLIVKYGIEGAFQIAQIIQQHPDPTPEAWAKLRALGLKPEVDYLREALLQAGYQPGAPLPPWILPPTTPVWSTTTTTVSAPPPTAAAPPQTT